MGGAKAATLEAQERDWDSIEDKYVCAECLADEAITRKAIKIQQKRLARVAEQISS